MNIQKVVIPPEKLKDYLLSPHHPIGKHKAKFFQEMGYSKDDWNQLETDIKFILYNNIAIEKEETEYGQKFEVKGIITTPSNRKVEIITIWIVHRGEDFPRFVTAYPSG